MRSKKYQSVKMTTPISAYTKLVTALNDANANNKVLDVSGLKTDGTGYKKIDMPKTTRGNKKWVDNFPVVSDNYGSYMLAMQIFGPDYIQYGDEYYRLYGGNKIIQIPKPVVAKSPSRLGPAILNFPVYQNTPAPITIQIPVQTAKAVNPKKVQVVQPPAIIPIQGNIQQTYVVPPIPLPIKQVPPLFEAGGYNIHDPRTHVVRPVLPRPIPIPVRQLSPRPISPRSATQIAPAIIPIQGNIQQTYVVPPIPVRQLSPRPIQLPTVKQLSPVRQLLPVGQLSPRSATQIAQQRARQIYQNRLPTRDEIIELERLLIQYPGIVLY
jgi:hypothetical protein